MAEQLQPLPSVIERQYLGSGGIHSNVRLEVIDELVIDGRNFRKELAEELDVPPDGVVIDVGSSTGKLSRYIRERFSGTLIDVDIDDYSLKLALSEQNKHNVQPAYFVHGNMIHLPFADKSADAIVNSLTYHHAEDEEQLELAIAETDRVLKDNGQHLVLVNGLYQKRLHGEYLDIATDILGIERIERFANIFSKETAIKALKARGFIINQIIPQQTAMRFNGEEDFDKLKMSLATYFIGYEGLISDSSIGSVLNHWKDKYLSQIAEDGFIDDNIDRVIIDCQKTTS